MEGNGKMKKKKRCFRREKEMRRVKLKLRPVGETASDLRMKKREKGKVETQTH